MRTDREPTYSAEAGLLHSPIKPRLLFPVHAAQFAGGTPRRNAVSDDEDWSGRPSARPRGLFAEELEARARRAERPPQAAHAELPAQPAHAVSDPEALWLSTMEHAKANTQPHPPRLSHQNEKLLAQLERVDWSSDEEDTRDD